jgi:hypothetical protein
MSSVGAFAKLRTSSGARKLTDGVAIDDPQPLRGLRAPEIIPTGTFIARRDVQSFYDVFRTTHAKHRFVP